jgi:hypothetical protein
VCKPYAFTPLPYLSRALAKYIYCQYSTLPPIFQALARLFAFSFRRRPFIMILQKPKNKKDSEPSKAFFVFWSGRRDSNSQRSAWEADALPLSHFRIVCAVARMRVFAVGLARSFLLYPVWGRFVKSFIWGGRNFYSIDRIWGATVFAAF